MGIKIEVKEGIKYLMKEVKKVRRKKFILAGFTICFILLFCKYTTIFDGISLYIFILGAYMFIYNTLYTITEWISQKRK